MSQDLSLAFTTWSFRASFSHASLFPAFSFLGCSYRHYHNEVVVGASSQRSEGVCRNTRSSSVYSSSHPFAFEGVEFEAGTMTIVHRIMFHSRVGKGERSSDPTPPSVAWATSPNVLACSAAIEPHRFNLDDRPLCSDRKSPFDHLQHRALVKSVSALYLFDHG
jgi:hypothetical protein